MDTSATGPADSLLLKVALEALAYMAGIVALFVLSAAVARSAGPRPRSTVRSVPARPALRAKKV